MTQSLTSDRDYLEIYLDGNVTISTSATVDTDAQFNSTVFQDTAYGIFTVTHNLGLVPLVRAFYDMSNDGTWRNAPILSGGGYQSRSGSLLTVSTTTTTKLILEAPSGKTNIPVYYRIYRFGTKGITSDERVDKIFLKSTANATVPLAINSAASQSVIQTFQLPPNVVALGASSTLNTLQFSTDQTTWYAAGTYLFSSFDTSSGPPGGPYARYFYTTAVAYANATNYYIYYEHNNPTATTIYVRYTLDLKS